MRKLVFHSLSALLLCSAGTMAASADPSPVEAQAPPEIADTGIKAGRVYLDPETGKPGPPPDTEAGTPTSRLSAETRRKLDRSDQGLEARTLPDGTLLVNLQGRFQNFSAATLDQHGDTHLYCNHSTGDIERVLEPAAESVTAQESAQ